MALSAWTALVSLPEPPCSTVPTSDLSLLLLPRPRQTAGMVMDTVFATQARSPHV